MARRREVDEEEERESFIYFFTVILVFMFLLGGWFIIKGLVNLPATNLQMNFWGIYTAGIGIGLIGLSSFETFYRDRYRVTAMGMLTIIFGYFYSVFAADPPIPDLAKGALFIFLGLIGGSYVYYLNEYGWELVRGNVKRYFGLVLLVAIFLVIWGLIANAYPEALSGISP